MLGVLVRIASRLSVITSYDCGSPLLLHVTGSIGLRQVHDVRFAERIMGDETPRGRSPVSKLRHFSDRRFSVESEVNVSQKSNRLREGPGRSTVILWIYF